MFEGVESRDRRLRQGLLSPKSSSFRFQSSRERYVLSTFTFHLAGLLSSCGRLWPCLRGSPQALAESPSAKFLKFAGTWGPKLEILRNLSEHRQIILQSGIPNSRIYVIVLNVALSARVATRPGRVSEIEIPQICWNMGSQTRDFT